MSEKDIRAAIRQVCSDLDERSRCQTTAATVGKVVLPLVLGIGLVGPACTSEVDDEGQGGATTTSGTQSGTQTGTSSGTTTGTTTGTGVGEPAPTYGVPGGGIPWGGSGSVGGQGGQGGATGGAATGGGGNG